MKKLLLFVLSFLAAGNISAQNDNEAAKKYLDNAFRIFDAKNARYGVLSVPGEYIMSEDKIIGQYYLSSYYSTSYVPGNLHRAMYGPHPDPMHSSVTMKNGDCTSDAIHPYFYPTTTSSNITRIEERAPSTYGSQRVRGMFIVEYSADNRIKSVKAGYIVLDKKNNPDFEYINSEATYEWRNDHEVIITSTGYYDQKKAKDTRIKIATSIYHHSVEKYKVETTNEAGRTTQYVTTGNETTIKEKSKDGEYRLTNKYITDGERVVKQEIYDVNPDPKARKGLVVIEYSLRKSSGYAESDKNLCTFTLVPLTSVYNVNGDVISQHTEGKNRKKKSDGTWGEWEKDVWKNDSN